ncbi:hypothetical protein Q3G72_005995 [Acer saccharum]|nr:hypothetical protein Q3G72_005995 [Acer saccharum]
MTRIGTHNKLGTKFTPQSSKNNRKKGSGVATTSRYVVKLNENCRASSSVKGPLTTSSPMEAVDVEDLDSASVLRHHHQEVNNFVPQPVDSMETVDEPIVHLSPVAELDRNFDLVASTLKEALAVISE